MKKKILITLMTFVLVVTMMPLSVFANSSNDLVRTKIGDSGLYLVGDRQAVESTDEYSLDGDYFVSDDGFKFVDIDAPGWTLTGEDNEYHVFISEMEGGANVTLEDLSVPRLEVTDETSTSITVPESSEVYITDTLYLMGETSLNDEGTINVEYQGVTSDRDTSLFVNGTTLNVDKTYGVGPAILIDGDMTINNGKVIAVNEVAGEMRSGLSCFGNLKVEDSAELFATGDNYGVLFGRNSELDSLKFLGSAMTFSYEEKDQMNVPVRPIPVTVGTRDLNTFQVGDENTTLARTIYHPAVVEPEIFKVSFDYQDGITPIKTVDVTEGETLVPPQDPTRDGYTFEGWYDNAACEGASYDFDSPVHMSFTLYAKWKENAGPEPGPQPAPPINPTNNTGAGGANTGDDNALLSLFAGLGIAVGISSYVIYRRVKSK